MLRHSRNEAFLEEDRLADKEAKTREIRVFGDDIYNMLDIEQQNLITAVKAVLANQTLIERALEAVQIFNHEHFQQSLAELYQPLLIPKNSVAINQHRFEGTLSKAFSFRERSKYRYHSTYLLSDDFATAGLREAMMLGAVIQTLQHVCIVKFNIPEASDAEKFTLIENMRSVAVFKGRLHELAPLLQAVTQSRYTQNDYLRDEHYYRRINQQHPFNKYILPALVVTVAIIGLGALAVGALATYGLVPMVMLVVGFAIGASFMAGSGLGAAKKIIDWVRIKKNETLFAEPDLRGGTHASLYPKVGPYQAEVGEPVNIISAPPVLPTREPEKTLSSSPALGRK